MESNEIDFQEIIHSLMNGQKVFPAKYLHLLSDLAGQDLSTLAKNWKELNLSRKISLLEDLEDLSDHDTILDFASISFLALEDPEDRVREVAINLLWYSEDKKAVPILIGLLKSDHSNSVRASAAAILGNYVLLGETEDIPAQLNEKILECLFLAYHTDKNKLVRRRSLESLGYSSLPEVNELIHKAIDSADLEWLASALYAMGRSADEEWSTVVMKHIDHPDDQVRLEAIRAAGELALESTREKLIEMLEQEKDDEFLPAIIWSLSQIGGEGVREAILKQAESVDDDETIELLEEALDNLDFTEELSRFDLIDINEPGKTD